MTRDGALATLRQLAASLPEAEPADAAARLLERTVAHEESGALLDALTERGALALVRETRSATC